jgi:hypothetical protein
MRLVARSAREYVARVLLEEDLAAGVTLQAHQHVVAAAVLMCSFQAAVGAIALAAAAYKHERWSSIVHAPAGLHLLKHAGPAPVTEELGSSAQGVYRAGDAAAKSYPKPEAYIVKNVGHFPDVSQRCVSRTPLPHGSLSSARSSGGSMCIDEQRRAKPLRHDCVDNLDTRRFRLCACRLVQAHLDRDDTTSAMVTMDWMVKNRFYQKWAFPFEQTALLYAKLGRLEEARDTARLALKQPWWSVNDLSRCVLSAVHHGGSSCRVLHIQTVACIKSKCLWQSRAPQRTEFVDFLDHLLSHV